MPKLYHLDGKPYHNTIEYSWVGIPNSTNYDEYMVNTEVADYIEKLEDTIKEYKGNIELKKETENKIINATKEFATINNIHYDDLTESMILNAIRELNQCFIMKSTIKKQK